MNAYPSSTPLKPVSMADVAAWFRDAWHYRDDYPSDALNWKVATRINTIVDRANARSGKDHSMERLRERRQAYLDAGAKARALGKILQPIEQYLLSETHMLAQYQVDDLELPTSSGQLAVIQEVQEALRAFSVQCEPPGIQDHVDDILWIAGFAERAWNTPPLLGPRVKKVPLGYDAGGSLVAFIRMVLEGIGLAREGVPGYGRDTISDHLRGRHNRTRDRSHVK